MFTIALLIILSFEIYLVVVNAKLKEKAKMQQNTIDYYNDILLRTLTREKEKFTDLKEITEHYNFICSKFNKKYPQKSSKRKYQHKQKGARTWKLV